MNWRRYHAVIPGRRSKCGEWIIAGEQFVATITGQRNSDALPRERRQQIRRQNGRIASRFVEACQDLGGEITRGVEVQDPFVMARAERTGDLPRIRGLVE